MDQKQDNLSSSTCFGRPFVSIISEVMFLVNYCQLVHKSKINASPLFAVRYFEKRKLDKQIIDKLLQIGQTKQN